MILANYVHFLDELRPMFAMLVEKEKKMLNSTNVKVMPSHGVNLFDLYMILFLALQCMHNFRIED